MRPNVRPDAKRILVFNPSYLGDTVLISPLAQCLSVMYPDAEVWICVRPESKPLVDGIPPVHGVVVYDKRNKQRGFIKSLAFIRTLKGYNFDIVLGLHLSIRSSYILRALQSETTTVVGFKDAVLSRFAYQCRTPKHSDDTNHEIERYLNIVRCLVPKEEFSVAAVKELAGNCQVATDPVLAENIQKYLSVINPENKPLVGIAPFSEWETKKWSLEGYAWVARELTLKGYLVFVFGQKKESLLGEQFMKMCMVDVVNLIGVMDIKGASTYIDALDLMITNDTGPMHMASALQTHVIAIFGPTVPRFGFLPYNAKYTLIENNNVSCRPCSMHGSANCPQGHFKCMDDIHPQRVYDAAMEVLTHV